MVPLKRPLKKEMNSTKKPLWRLISTPKSGMVNSDERTVNFGTAFPFESCWYEVLILISRAMSVIATSRAPETV